MKFTLLEISNEPYLSYQAVLPHDQKVKTKISLDRKELLREIKSSKLIIINNRPERRQWHAFF